MQTLQLGISLQSGKYIIKKVLGQGGFGITYLAENTMLEGKVAIKEFFFKEYCSRDEEKSHVSIPIEGNKAIVNRFKQKFIKEARTIFKLNHQNIVRIHDIFEENDTAYYVMDYIEGESLGETVNRRDSIPEAEAIGYIKEVGVALEYIHGKSMNHLDIKPSNIMKRQEDGQILVIDFGVSKQYDAETAEGTTTTPVGISHGYSPTEQYRINGVQTFSPQSDVYALAATLFKLLTGVTPPEADEVRDEGLPVEELRARGVSESVISTIVNAMKSRHERTQCVQEFMLQLETASEKPNVCCKKDSTNGPIEKTSYEDTQIIAPITGLENGYKWVDLGLSVKWATCNVGATNPEDYGDYFAWGEIRAKSRYNMDTCFDCSKFFWMKKYIWHTYKKGGKNKIIPSRGHDTARENWGGSWRMPTDEEYVELCTKCTWIWTTQNGHKGYMVVGKNGNSIFLPAAGSRYDTNIVNREVLGCYWSSTLCSISSDHARFLGFGISSHYTYSFKRCSGRSVRPVTQ